MLPRQIVVLCLVLFNAVRSQAEMKQIRDSLKTKCTFLVDRLAASEEDSTLQLRSSNTYNKPPAAGYLQVGNKKAHKQVDEFRFFHSGLDTGFDTNLDTFMEPVDTPSALGSQHVFKLRGYADYKQDIPTQEFTRTQHILLNGLTDKMLGINRFQDSMA